MTLITTLLSKKVYVIIVCDVQGDLLKIPKELKMGYFSKIINHFYLLSFFTKNSAMMNEDNKSAS